MSLTILDQLEEKIKQAVETIQLLQLELAVFYYTGLWQSSTFIILQ